MGDWSSTKAAMGRRKELNALRADAVKCLRIMVDLQIAASTDAQIDLAGKCAVSAIARYTIACQEEA